MISDARLAELAEAAYSDPPHWQAGDAFVCLTQIDDFAVVAFRGTEPEHLADLLADVDAVPVRHPQLGFCHAGFLANVLGVAAAMLRDLAGLKVVLTGHSKGAAEAALFGGLLVARGTPPFAMTTFGMPRPGLLVLCRIVGSIPGTDYRHADDPITRVPIGFCHPRPLTQLGRVGLKLDPIADHYIRAYRAALAAQQPCPSDASLAGDNLAAAR